jgi:hypothetical protein
MAGWSMTLSVSTPVCATPITAVSRKVHGGINRDVPLPLAGLAGVECRQGQGGGGNQHQIVLTFANPITSVASASVTSGVGSVVGSPIVASNTVTVNLTGVNNAQKILVTLVNVSDGTNVANVVVPMTVLFGDVTENGNVNSSDVSQVQFYSGAILDGTNFYNDITVNNSVNSSDVSGAQSASGTSAPR